MLKSIKLTNLLSFGPDTPALELEPLNVLIGANGSGKSNLIEAISLLQAAPRDLIKPLVEGGGLREWLWKGSQGTPVASIEVGIEYPRNGNGSGELLCYKLAFTHEDQQLVIVDEWLSGDAGAGGDYYRRNGSHDGTTSPNGSGYKSVLAQAWLGNDKLIFVRSYFAGIRIYRNWSFAPNSAARNLQAVTANSDFLEEDASNLTAVLHKLLKVRKLKKQIIRYLNDLYAVVDGIRVRPLGEDFLQLQVKEGEYYTPAVRLSEGTLRWLALLAILLHPAPPPLICIEEPEAAIHPDLISTLAKLLQEMAERTQVIISTHSEALINEFGDMPEAVVVYEKPTVATAMRRLNAAELDEWLADFSLGRLWSSGQIGGNRW